MKTKILISILLLSGALILLYPSISDYINSLSQAQVVENYTNQVEKMEDEEMEQELEKARAYNENLARTVVIDPFTETMGQELEEDYLNVLNVDGQMGTIIIPKINVELPVYHGTGAEVLQKGIGHLQNTAVPVGGEGTHAVLSGHRGLPSAKLFSDLDEMEIGDMFYIQVLNETLAYQVDQILTVLPDQTEALQPVEGKDYVTLVTCTPYGVNTHRLLVRGVRTAFTPEDQEELEDHEKTKDKTGKEKLILFAVTGAVVLFFLYRLFSGSRAGRKDGGTS